MKWERKHEWAIMDVRRSTRGFKTPQQGRLLTRTAREREREEREEEKKTTLFSLATKKTGLTLLEKSNER